MEKRILAPVKSYGEIPLYYEKTDKGWIVRDDESFLGRADLTEDDVRIFNLIGEKHSFRLEGRQIFMTFDNGEDLADALNTFIQTGIDAHDFVYLLHRRRRQKEKISLWIH